MCILGHLIVGMAYVEHTLVLMPTIYCKIVSTKVAKCQPSANVKLPIEFIFIVLSQWQLWRLVTSLLVLLLCQTYGIRILMKYRLHTLDEVQG